MRVFASTVDIGTDGYSYDQERHRREFDQRIIASWQLHEQVELNISTERLMAMVEDDTRR